MQEEMARGKKVLLQGGWRGQKVVKESEGIWERQGGRGEESGWERDQEELGGRAAEPGSEEARRSEDWRPLAGRSACCLHSTAQPACMGDSWWPTPRSPLQVQDAAPSVLSLIDANVEAELGGRYGGDAESGRNGILDSVYLAVGRVLTISGRTIKANALQQGSTACSSAAAAIDELLVLLPREPMEEAQAFRASRRR